MNDNRKRILQVNIDNNGGNGAFSLVRYLYKHLSNFYVFDYYTMGKFLEDKVYEDIINDGGICYSANLRRNKFIGHICLPFNFYKFLKDNIYDTVYIHSEVAYKHFLYTIAAKKARVKKIIIHSHSNDIDGNHKGIKYFFHKILRNKINKYGTDFLACSMPAAEWMFTPNNIKSDRFHLIINGISPSEYKFDEMKRDYIRKKLNMDSNIVIGHVGSLKKVKNQIFLLEVFSKLDLKKYKLILVGDGEDRRSLEQRARDLGCYNEVSFLGSRNDVDTILQGIDIFTFPSLFEGIPMSLIEAQTVGVPVIASNKINPIIKVNTNFKFLQIESNDIEKWVKEIQMLENTHIKGKGFENMSKSIFNIEKSAEDLRKVYL